MRNISYKLLIFVCLLLSATHVSAVVITFDDTSDFVDSWSDLTPNYQELDGYLFEASNYGNISYWTANAYGLAADYNDTDHLSSAGNTITITKVDGGDFDFSSLYIGTGNTSVYALTFTGKKDGSTVATYSYNAPAGNGFSYINWQFVDSFSAFSGIDTLQVGVPAAGYSFFFEDVTVNAVPEPATALTLAAGGLMLGLYRRFFSLI